MKKILLFLLVIGVYTTINATPPPAEAYELNIRTIQNDNAIGGTFKVAVEVRSLTGSALTVGGADGASWGGQGGIKLKVSHNDLALTFVSGAINPVFASFATQSVLYNTGGVPGLIGVNILSNTDAVTYAIPTTWTQILELTFTIADKDEALGFNLSGSTKITDHTTAKVTLKQGPRNYEVVYDNGTWSGGNGIGGAPASDGSDVCKKLIIREPVTVSTPMEVDVFDINYDGVLTIASGGSLKPWCSLASAHTSAIDDLIIGSDNTGYGQYLGPEAAMKFTQYWGAAPLTGWRNMAFPVTGLADFYLGEAPINLNGGTSAICTPVAGGAWGNYVNTTNLYEFTAGVAQPCATSHEHEWVGLTGLPAGGANGYDVYLGGGFFWSNGTVSVTGTSIESTSFAYTQSTPHQNGTGSQALTSLANQQGWDGKRLVANPFACGLNVAQWATDNGLTAANIKIYDRVSNTQITAPAVIAPGQAFYMKETSNSTLNFDIYAHGVLSAATLTKNDASSIAIRVTSESGATEASIAYNDLATAGFDNKIDGLLVLDMFSDNPIVALEAITNERITYLDLNVVPMSAGAEKHAVYVESNVSGNHVISVSNENLPAHVTSVEVEDLMLAPGVLHDVLNDTYSFVNEAGSIDNKRFVIHVNASANASNDINSMENLAAWFNGNVLNLESNVSLEGASIQVMNTAGQLISVGTSDDAIIVSQAGVYLVNVTTANGSTKTVKVVKL